MGRPSREEQLAADRPKRISVYEANRNKIGVDGLDKENYYYRWVNDTEGRIAMFLSAGYEFVDKTGNKVGDGGVDQVNGTSSKYSQGMGGGITAYLMRLPRDLYEEDQKRKQAEDVDALEADMKRQAKEASDYGKLEINLRRGSQV